MKRRFVLVLLSFLMIIATMSGCVDKDVPVLKVNITFVENESIAEVTDISLTPGSINYLGRPRNIQAEKFPAIAGRVSFLKGNLSIGPWETLSYNGGGTYTFNIGFSENRYPKVNETVHVTIMVVNEKGERIGYFIEDIKWK